MRRSVLLAAGVVAAALVGRRAVPVLAARLPEACGRLMARMPDSAPPKRVAAELARIREQNEEILRILRGTEGAAPAVRDTSG